MSNLSRIPPDPEILSYPKVRSDILAHLALGVGIAILVVTVRAFALVSTWEGEWPLLIFLEAFKVQATAWGPSIVEKGSWWFTAAIASVAILLPGALSASRQESVLSGVSLRRHYANVSRIVSSVTICAFLFALGGANYSLGEEQVALLFLAAATLVVTMIAALISSHEGYDALASLLSAREQAAADLELRQKILASAASKNPHILLVVFLGIVQFFLIPILLLMMLLAMDTFGNIDIGEQQAAVIVVTWISLSVTSAFSAGIGMISAISAKARQTLRCLFAAVIGAASSAAFVVVFPQAFVGLEAWLFFGSVTICFAILAMVCSSWPRNSTLQNLFRFTFVGTLMVRMAHHSKRRVESLTTKIAQEQSRRREVAQKSGKPVFLVRGS